MSSMRFSTRRVMNQPPAQPEHADERERLSERAADDVAQPAASSMSRPTSRRKPPGRRRPARAHAAARASASSVLRVGGLELARARSRTPGGSAPILPADLSPAWRGDEVERGAGRARAALDDVHEAAQPADSILLGKAAGLRLDGGDELIGEKRAARSRPRSPSSDEREEREDDQIRQATA